MKKSSLPKEKFKERKKCFKWISRFAEFVQTPIFQYIDTGIKRTVAEGVDSGSSFSNGFVALNGGILAGCSPYELRQVLLHAEAISSDDANKVEGDTVNPEKGVFFFSSHLPFVLINQPLLTKKIQKIEFLEADLRKKGLIPSSCSKMPQLESEKNGGDITECLALSTEIEMHSSAVHSFSIFYLTLPSQKSPFRTGSSSRACDTFLFLMPCHTHKLLSEIGDLFQRPVLGIPPELFRSDAKMKTLASSTVKEGSDGKKILPCEELQEIPGLFIVPEFISTEEHDTILNEINSNRCSLSLEYLARRRVAHFNRKFIYGVNQLGKEGEEVNNNPSFYDWMRERLQNNDSMVMIDPFVYPVHPHEYSCDQLTINYYDYSDGSTPGIAHHVDAHSPFGDYIFIVSLGSYTVMEFIQYTNPSEKERTYHAYVPPRSLVVFSGECRYAWTHCISERRTDTISEKIPTLLRGDRVSLTWRKGRSEKHSRSTCLYPALCDGEVE